jgi:hypothetical protein
MKQFPSIQLASYLAGVRTGSLRSGTAWTSDCLLTAKKGQPRPLFFLSSMSHRGALEAATQYRKPTSGNTGFPLLSIQPGVLGPARHCSRASRFRSVRSCMRAKLQYCVDSGSDEMPGPGRGSDAASVLRGSFIAQSIMDVVPPTRRRRNQLCLSLSLSICYSFAFRDTDSGLLATPCVTSSSSCPKKTTVMVRSSLHGGGSANKNIII